MKTKIISVDFTKDELGTIAREGELNRTQIVFELDEDLQKCDFINVEFGTNENLEDDECPVLEYLHPDEGGNTLTIKLNQDMTVDGMLSMQLVGYVVDSETSEPHMIVKSPVVSGVVTPSLKGKGKVSDGTPSLLDRILAKVHTLLEKAHVHSNAKTLAQFSNWLVEAGGAEGPVIMPDVAGIDRLKFWNSYIRYCSDGAVIMHTHEVEKDGVKYQRLWLSRDEFFLTGSSPLPHYIDIPVKGVKEVTENSTPELTFNGIELDFGITGDTDQTETIPIVSVLPETANERDVVLYRYVNSLSTFDSGSEIHFNWDWIKSLAQDDSVLSLNTQARTNNSFPMMSITVSKNSTRIQANISLQPSSGNATVYTVVFSANDENGYSFDAEKSTVKIVVNSVATTEQLSEPITSVVAVDFSEIISATTPVGFDNITFFWSKPRLLYYKNSTWKELYDVTVPTKTSDLEADAFYDRIENPTVTALEPNKEYVFGRVETLTLDFAEGIADKRNEYLFSFISGETATVLTLPSSVKWVNELTVEANKRYEISIVDNIALWCAVDYTAEVSE